MIVKKREYKYKTAIFWDFCKTQRFFFKDTSGFSFNLESSVFYLTLQLLMSFNCIDNHV